MIHLLNLYYFYKKNYIDLKIDLNRKEGGAPCIASGAFSSADFLGTSRMSDTILVTLEERSRSKLLVMSPEFAIRKQYIIT